MFLVSISLFEFPGTYFCTKRLAILLDIAKFSPSFGESPPLMKTRKEIKIEEARKEYQQLITAGWQVTEPKW